MKHFPKLIPFQDFISKYNIDIDKYNSTGLLWDDLEVIYNDYVTQESQLKSAAESIFNMMMSVNGVHSVRYRVKSPEHLIEKIIRKKITNHDDNITIENYLSRLTDLIGVRALHLFKNDWSKINDSIIETWDLNEAPTAYYREGDQKELLSEFEEKGCINKVHPFGYRSVHYIVKTKPAKVEFYCEIQVRTIFEEGWSEIDHTIRYPYDLDNKLLSDYLLLVNRLAGNADEMGTYLLFLKNALKTQEEIHINELKHRDKQITDLQTKISKLEISKNEKEEINVVIDEIAKSITAKGFSSTFNNLKHLQLANAITYSPQLEILKQSTLSNIHSKIQPIINNPAFKLAEAMSKLPPGLK